MLLNVTKKTGSIWMKENLILYFIGYEFHIDAIVHNLRFKNVLLFSHFVSNTKWSYIVYWIASYQNHRHISMDKPFELWWHYFVPSCEFNENYFYFCLCFVVIHFHFFVLLLLLIRCSSLHIDQCCLHSHILYWRGYWTCCIVLPWFILFLPPESFTHISKYIRFYGLLVLTIVLWKWFPLMLTRCVFTSYL